MTLSMENRKEILEFFNDVSLADTFIQLYDFQEARCEELVFVNRVSIIGFGCPKEYLRCYVTKSPTDFFLKIKTCDVRINFRAEDVEIYKKIILYNDIQFMKNPDNFAIAAKTPKKASSKGKSRKSQEKKDLVLSKLKNRNRARKFTEQEFNNLADWTYCSSFNENGYIYTLPNGNCIECDSKSEITLLNYLISNKIALAVGGQNLLIKYNSAFRRDLDYYPDIVILTNDYHIAIIEVKPVTAMSNHKNIEKYEALKEYCDERGYEYMMIDPDHNYMTFDEMMKLNIPSAIRQRVDAYLINLIGKKGACLLEKEDIPILYADFADDYKKGDFVLYLHALVIQKGWYNRFTNGFMVYETPCQY